MDELEEIMLSKIIITVPVLAFIYGKKNKDDLKGRRKKKNHKTGPLLRPCNIH